MENMRFKVGDRVRIKSIDWYNENKDNYDCVYAGNGFVFWKNMVRHCGEIMKITSVKVDPENSNKGYYFMENSEERWTDEMIEGLVEEETKPNIIKDAKTYWDSIKDAWICPEGYIFKDENGNEILTSKIILEKKKKEVTYPKTYEECCDVLGLNTVDNDTLGMTVDVPMHYSPLIINFTKLLICRDAYWKIAGEEMGLDKHWEPAYAITRNDGCIVEIETGGNDEVLEFPTEEMRDAFYENFKELIEECKELL